jgi:hypothetical protein
MKHREDSDAASYHQHQRQQIKGDINWAMKFLLAVCLFVSTLFLGISRASADTITYSFTGTCLDCSDPQGTLVLQNYTFGDSLEASELVNFTYTSSLANIDITQANLSSLSGSLGSSPGSYNFAIIPLPNGGQDLGFNTGTDGTWCFGCLVGGGTIGIDHGVDGTFSLASASTPEPSTLWLFGTGLTTVAALRRRVSVRGNRVPRES